MAEMKLQIDGQKRAEKFVYEVLETDTVYYLQKGEYAETTESHNYENDEGNPAPVIPFWSKTFISYARKWADDLEIQEISLESFVKNWIRGMNEDGVIVGLNWDQNGIGYECDPIDLLEFISQAAEGQEISLSN